MKVAIISANLGSYEQTQHAWVKQAVPEGVELEIHRITDKEFPLRPKAMMPALQVGLLKWFGCEYFPNRDVLIWIDSSCALTSPTHVARWLDVLGDHNLAVFKHPERKTVIEEYDFIVERMRRPNEQYLTKRYSGEWLDEEYRYISQRSNPAHLPLYATTAFAYRPHYSVERAFMYTWLAKTKWHLHDQLAFAYELNFQAQSIGVDFTVIQENYQKSSLLEFVRNKK